MEGSCAEIKGSFSEKWGYFTEKLDSLLGGMMSVDELVFFVEM